MHILYIVPYTPTLIRVRSYNLICYLARRGYHLTLASLWETPADRQALDELQAQGIQIIAAPLTRARKAWNILRTLPTRIPLQAAYCWQPALARELSFIIHNSQFDIIHVEHLRGAQYGLYLHSPLSTLHPQIPLVWDSVDCITYLFEQAAQQSPSLFSRWMTRFELGRTRRREGWLVNQFDRVLVTSPADKAALENISTASSFPSPISHLSSPISILPNGVDLEYFTPGDETPQPGTVVFSGKMSYHANVTAALYLVEQVMPRVWEQRPNARLVIAGSRPPSEIRRLARVDSRVEVTGYLPDIRVPLRQASLAVAPLLYGAGIQNKVLEAMACGTPVVASPLAVSALSHLQPGVTCLVADTPQTFAEAILSLLEDEALRQQVGQAGRRYVEAHHNWNDIAARLEEIYRQEINGRAAR